MKPTIEQRRRTDLDQSQIDQINAIAGVDVTDLRLWLKGIIAHTGLFWQYAVPANGLLLVHRRRDHPR